MQNVKILGIKKVRLFPIKPDSSMHL